MAYKSDKSSLSTQSTLTFFKSVATLTFGTKSIGVLTITTPIDEGYLFDSEGYALQDSEGFWLDTTE